MYGIIYKATNKINGKSYIGQTTKKLRQRIGGHLSSVASGNRNHHRGYKCRHYNKDLDKNIFEYIYH